VSSIEEIREALERNRLARLAAGAKPISELEGEGMGSFAEDDPELHEANRNEPDSQ
jgi:hypothetical protein